MRHRKSGRKFNMDSTQRKAMFRNMATSLLLHGQIKTTQARAKELRKFAERLITIGKKAPSQTDLASLSGEALAQARADRVAAIRRLKAYVFDDAAVGRVMNEYADRYRARSGGYTRVLKIGRPRPGDNAAMAVIQLVTGEVVAKEKVVPVAAEVEPSAEAAAEE
jgi:large subunit ribosomal protein L17